PSRSWSESCATLGAAKASAGMQQRNRLRIKRMRRPLGLRERTQDPGRAALGQDVIEGHMELTREFMLERFLARDAAWNGRFVTGVVTTGIYCLPSCTARKPRPENVRFFDTE